MRFQKIAIGLILIACFSSNISQADEDWEGLKDYYGLSDAAFSRIIAEMGNHPKFEDVARFLEIGFTPVQGLPQKPIPGPREEIQKGIEEIQRDEDERMKEFAGAVTTVLPQAGMAGDAIRGDYGGVICRFISGCFPMTTIRGLCVKGAAMVCDRLVDPGE